MKYWVALLILLVPFLSKAQRITGKVTNSENEPLGGATIQWLDLNQGTFTNSAGIFELKMGPASAARMQSLTMGTVLPLMA